MSPKLFWRRLKTKLITLKSNIFTVRNITNFLLVLVVVIFIAPIGLQLAFTADYGSKFLTQSEVQEDLQVEYVAVFADTANLEVLNARIAVGKQILNNYPQTKLLISGKAKQENNATRKAANLAAQLKIPEKRLVVDYMSRNSYEFCRRISDEFTLEKVVLISQRKQLTRLLYTCNSLGIEAQGVVAEGGYNDILSESWKLVRDIWYVNFLL